MMLTSVNSLSIMSELGIIDPWDAAAGGILSPVPAELRVSHPPSASAS